MPVIKKKKSTTVSPMEKKTFVHLLSNIVLNKLWTIKPQIRLYLFNKSRIYNKTNLHTMTTAVESIAKAK